MENLLKEKPFGNLCEYKKYNSLHGWVNRGDLTDEEVKSEVEDAINRCLEFLNKHF